MIRSNTNHPDSPFVSAAAQTAVWFDLPPSTGK
jgi:hypothetical protein